MRAAELAPLALAATVAGCGDPAALAAHHVDGRVWVHHPSGAQIAFPQGWQIAVDPQHFRADLPRTALEGRRDDASLAITWSPLPGGADTHGWLGRPTGLDQLQWFAPIAAELRDDHYRLERLPRCGGAIERVTRDPDGRALVQHAVGTGAGLLLLHGWTADAAPVDALRELTCAQLTLGAPP